MRRPTTEDSAEKVWGWDRTHTGSQEPSAPVSVASSPHSGTLDRSLSLSFFFCKRGENPVSSHGLVNTGAPSTRQPGQVSPRVLSSFPLIDES